MENQSTKKLEKSMFWETEQKTITVPSGIKANQFNYPLPYADVNGIYKEIGGKVRYFPYCGNISMTHRMSSGGSPLAGSSELVKKYTVNIRKNYLQNIEGKNLHLYSLEGEYVKTYLI